RLISEVDAKENFVSSTAQSINYFLGTRYANSNSSSCEQVENIILLSKQLMVRINPFLVRPIKITEQIKKALSALQNKELDKDEFFKKIWGNQRYSPDIHQGTIKALISRVRLTGVEIQSKNGKLSLPNCHVVD